MVAEKNKFYKIYKPNKKDRYKKPKKRLYYKDLDDDDKKIAKQINKDINNYKNELYSLVESNVNKTRTLNNDYIVDSNIISVFESSLTRMLGMQKNKIYDDLIVVRAYYYDILQGLILNGFIYNDEKYVCLTASAGQIRTKKTVFIKESLLTEHQNTLMCGLSIDKINAKGGVNVNKLLAYLALCNSATDLWENYSKDLDDTDSTYKKYDKFDITKTIVVPDLETLVNGEVDYINDKTYKITRQVMDVPICHTDGVGIILPRYSRKNFMVRLPFVKGLLSPFPFDKFIRLANKKNPDKNHAIVKDIWNNDHDILKEDIQIIFTRSQFKMWQFFTDWNEYIDNYKKYNCLAGKCNEEKDFFKYAKFNYQMMQSLTDVTDEELKTICERTNDKIKKLATDRKTMLQVFGVTDRNIEKNYLQQALELYPELLADAYTKETLLKIKERLVREARASKVDIYGKYTFIIPDLYAFCEYLFLGDENPKGLLENGDVYCKLFKDSPELDCLRSPQLYREHAIRNNVIDDTKKEWLLTNGLYTSTHDLISKILQFDVDGDCSLVCADPTIISIAKRNMQGIVPLYYEMKKAKPSKITNATIYKGLIDAYKGSNIGEISNNISKIWNSEEFDEETKLHLIKLLCMENNFAIDYAKALYKPKRPKNLKAAISEAIKGKLPHFFIYAKGKTSQQVENINNSVVNRFENLIVNEKLLFTPINISRFRYKILMSDSKVNIDDKVIDKYNELVSKIHLSMKEDSDDEEKNNYEYQYQKIRNQILEINSNPVLVTDMLIKYLFGIEKSKYKKTFWGMFGDIVLENIKKNLAEGYILCDKCGKRVKKRSNSHRYCDKCKEPNKTGVKMVVCVDCDAEYETNSKNNRTPRCEKCYDIYRKAYKRERNRNNKIIVMDKTN